MTRALKIFLASESPRRRDLLNLAGVSFEIAKSEFDEASLRGTLEDPREYVCTNAIQKGRWLVNQPSFRKKIKGPTIVISADTIVVLGKTILEKPRDVQNAKDMLRSYSEKKHTVLTSLCLHLLKSETGSFQVLEETFATDVYFRKLSEEEIQRYVETGEPMDKAGAYSVQGRAASFVKSIQGSHTNVIGLPLAETIEALERADKIFETMD